MTTRTDLRAALQHPNVKAFLRVIREGETNQTDDAYRMMYGGGYFASFNDHPRQAITKAGYTSTAAGAYQFLAKTWDGLVKQYSFEDFSPQCQDEGAVALIAGRKALQAVMDGNLSDALERCSWEWASLPPSRYDQSVMSGERIYSTYEKWGGQLTAVKAPTTVEPQEEGIMAIPALVTAAAQALWPLVADLFRAHGSKVSERNAEIVERIAPALTDIAMNVSTAPNQQAAVEQILQNPELSKEFRQQVAMDLDKLVGMLERVVKVEDDSRDRAMARAQKDAHDFAPSLIQKQFYILAALAAATVIAFMLAIYFKANNEILVGLMVLFTGLVNSTSTKWGTMIEYRFGSSAGSAAKDEIIAAAKK
jgi:muramidase (phage lysozyme)